nr:immunoglobulin light chain junction region [Macaca mulatta]MOW11030.1 immunoglobulin light chain junction region [Macaca mulatta]
CLQGYTAPFTF